MSSRKTIAVVIPVFNVEKFVKPSLDSVAWCDEIIIVDMFSTDRTKEICTSYPNCRFFEKKGYIYGNVNFGIENAKSDWIMRLDSDEVISAELRKSIEAVLNDPNPAFDGYSIKSNLYFMGYLLRYGFGKDNWRKMLFKKGFAKYDGQTEHEHLVSTGKWGELNGSYDHYTNPTISMWMQKTNYYTDRDIERLTDPEELSGLKILYRTLRWFQRYYFYPYQGFRDGMPGFVVALLAAVGFIMLDCKRWEKARRMKLGPNYIPPHPNA